MNLKNGQITLFQKKNINKMVALKSETYRGYEINFNKINDIIKITAIVDINKPNHYVNLDCLYKVFSSKEIALKYVKNNIDDFLDNFSNTSEPTKIDLINDTLYEETYVSYYKKHKITLNKSKNQKELNKWTLSSIVSTLNGYEEDVSIENNYNKSFASSNNVLYVAKQIVNDNIKNKYTYIRD